MTWQDHIKRRLPLVLGLSMAAVAAACIMWSAQDGAGAAGVENLCRERICPRVEVGSFHWVYSDRVKESGSMEWHPAVFLGREGESPRDLYVADFKVSSSGDLRQMRRLTNLSRTAIGDEYPIAVSGQGDVAVGTRLADTVDSVLYVDFEGEPAHLTEEWSTAWKVANGITNLQRTGRSQGVGFKTFVFRKALDNAELSFSKKNELLIKARDFEARVGKNGIAGGDGITVQEMVKGRPAPLAWAVDTVRAHPWVGRRKIEWLEKYWFDFNDWLARTRYELVGEDDSPEDPGSLEKATFAAASEVLPGWPPPPIEPILKKPRAQEGIWVPLSGKITEGQQGGPPLFYETFWRSDPERPFSKIHMTAWDPNFLELRMQAGVREPISTTGFRGEGEIPREDVPGLVAAFNGAFQALHGEWGMALDRKYVLPPKAYGATIAIYEDTSVGLGTWPHPMEGMPEGMRDLRQNVQPLVEDGKLNPYRRKWWGGVPEGVEERVITVRSGLCLTFAGKMIYFWGGHLSPESLGGAMMAAGCDYGVHLDMNAGHCGFEYYRVEEGDSLARSTDFQKKTEAVGSVPRRPELSFMARKLVREMGHMRFPRYLSRDPRDFFYLLRRQTIFDVPDGGKTVGDDLSWKAAGAQEGMPVVMVEAVVDGVTLRRVDLSSVEVTVEKERDDGALLSIPFATEFEGINTGLTLQGEVVATLKPGAPGLRLEKQRASWTESVEGEGDVVQGLWPSAAKLVDVRGALGFDSTGYLVVSGTKDSGDGGALEAMEAAGVKKTMVLIHPGDGRPVAGWLVFRQIPTPLWKRVFEDVEPVAPEVWREVFRNRGKLLDREAD